MRHPDVYADLLAQSDRERANLIVAGVYSHGPLTERVLVVSPEKS